MREIISLDETRQLPQTQMIRSHIDVDIVQSLGLFFIFFFVFGMIYLVFERLNVLIMAL